MFVGEQPGDAEDVGGRPFVGPAGTLLATIMEDAGIARDEVYLTNAVKHFKLVKTKKRRLHDKPNRRELKACQPWLEAEIAAVRPKVLVALGASAASVLFGTAYRITKQRGEVMATPWCESTLGTHHPSAILRAPDHDARAAMRAMFLQDLRRAEKLIRG